MARKPSPYTPSVLTTRNDPRGQGTLKKSKEAFATVFDHGDYAEVDYVAVLKVGRSGDELRGMRRS